MGTYTQSHRHSSCLCPDVCRFTYENSKKYRHIVWGFCFVLFYLFLAVLDFLIIIIIIGLHMLSLVAVSMGYSCGARASHCCGLSCFRAQALGTQAQ